MGRKVGAVNCSVDGLRKLRWVVRSHFWVCDERKAALVVRHKGEVVVILAGPPAEIEERLRDMITDIRRIDRKKMRRLAKDSALEEAEGVLGGGR